MTRRLVRGAFVVGVVLSANPLGAQDDVLAGYRKYYSGDKAGAREALLRVLQTSPGHLPARFGLLNILLDDADEDPRLQASFERDVDGFLADAEKRYGRTSQDSEALFYLANACMLRAQYRVNHDKGIWGAARDGARAKRLIDAYVRRHPEHGDAYFTLGLYNYYVDIAPAFVRVLRLFLFLPGGNRAEGLRQIERAYSNDSLFAFPAGMILMEIYSTYEHKGAEAVRVGEKLLRDYPNNPDVGLQLAEIYASPAIDDPGRASAQYDSVLKRESARSSGLGSAKHRARFGLVAMRQQQWRFEDSIRVLSEGIAENPLAPGWVMPTLLLRRGNNRALIVDPAAREDALRVRAEARWKDFHKSRTSSWHGSRAADGLGKTSFMLRWLPAIGL